MLDKNKLIVNTKKKLSEIARPRNRHRRRPSPYRKIPFLWYIPSLR